jgi:hypothetical protein
MIYKRRWFIPLVIVFILFGAWAFRWETVSIKQETLGSRTYTVKWDKDRWTNANYIETLYSSEVTQNPPKEWAATTNATVIWIWALLIDGIWFAVALWKDRKEAKEKSSIKEALL